ncbi:hypothetical protein BGZ59_006214 [Podila verticillata]|nr:hypothetical protein BGZ59_006214 [Podila verticillata]
MDSLARYGVAGSNKIWSNAVNTLLNAMESILLDEDLQPLWPREHHGQDSKKKNFLPPTPPVSSPHDPTFSPPLKRKKDPFPPSDRSTKSQRMTDHLTARLASSLHVSATFTPTPIYQHHTTGLENSRGFHRVQDPANILGQPSFLQSQADPSNNMPEHLIPRKYKKAIRSRSNPTTPISSHPPSPGSSHTNDDPSTNFAVITGLGLDSFSSSSSPLILDPRRSSRSSLFMRRESRSNRSLKAPHHMALATRLALFHRILSTTRSEAQVKDMDIWITEQMERRNFPDRHTLEAALTSHVQILVGALTALADGVPQHQSSGGQDQEITIYNSIQQTVDSVLESAQWLCGPEFEMSISRICPQWPAHEKSIEQFVHYVQVVESMKEVSGRFQHPQELAEDLARCQEMIDYQRTLFGETLRNHGLEWRALGFPPMEGLVQQTQDWILNMARTLTVKIKAEVHLTLEQHGQPEMELEEVAMSRAITDVMELVLQGALFTGSCLELVGKRCPMLVTAWTELASQYCYLTLTKRKEQALLASRPRTGKITGSSLFLSSNESRKHAPSGINRGLLLRTMELFENISRLLQCLMEMHEEEALGGHSPSITDESLGGDDDDQSAIFGTSGASSDQDEAMDIATSSSSSSFHSQGMQDDPLAPAFGNLLLQQLQHRGTTQRRRAARQSMDPAALQRWIAMESLASILVEIGLELCGSMAEALGSSDTSVRLESSLASFKPTLPTTIPLLHQQEQQFQLQDSLSPRSRFGVLESINNNSRNVSTTGHHHQPMSSAARAAAAISSLTSFAGGNAMALGTGGIGLIYIQFVVRLISKIIEFAGQDSHQEQRLLRIHSSLQNLEFALAAT